MKPTADSCFCEGGPSRSVPNPLTMKGSATPIFTGVKMKEVPPPGWILWGHLSEKGPSPAPTIIQVGSDMMNMLCREDFNKMGFILREQGYQCVATDSLGYGFDLKPGEPEGLPCWRMRLEKGDPLMAEFTAKISRLLDHLVSEGYTDPERVAIYGSCRGGFMALHCAAADPRFKRVVAFTPSTDLCIVSEFAGLENHPATRALSVHNLVDKLADRAVWSCLGNRDDRVGTESCLGFMRKLMDAAVARNGNKAANIEFHLSAVVGHATYMLAHEEAAAWLHAQMAPSPSM